MDNAITQGDVTEIKRCISNNHRLLQQLGVVPPSVSDFINAVEKKGGAAKICGAGSTQAGAAGVVLVVSEEDITELCQQCDYQLMPIQGDSRGATVL